MQLLHRERIGEPHVWIDNANRSVGVHQRSENEVITTAIADVLTRQCGLERICAQCGRQCPVIPALDNMNGQRGVSLQNEVPETVSYTHLRLPPIYSV